MGAEICFPNGFRQCSNVNMYIDRSVRLVILIVDSEAPLVLSMLSPMFVYYGFARGVWKTHRARREKNNARLTYVQIVKRRR